MKCFDIRFVGLAMVTVALKSTAAETGIPLVDIKSVDPTIVIELR